MFKFLKKFFAASPENPSTNLANPSEWLVDVMGGGVADSGMVVNRLTAMRSSAVFRCVSLLSGAVASLPWEIYKREGLTRQLAPNHSAFQLLATKPNDLMTSYTFRQMMMLNLLLDGNFFAVIGFNGAGQAAELIPFPAQMVEVVRKGNVQTYIIKPGGGADNIIVPASQMIHVMGLSLDGVRGLSVIGAVARHSVGLALALDTFASKIHANSARPSGVVSSVENLSEQAFRRLKLTFDSLYAGSYNAGKTVFLDNGMTWNPMQISPADAQTLESRHFQTSDIARIFGVPPHLIGETDKTSSWGTGIEQMTLGFLTYTLGPWLAAIEAEVNCKILNQRYFNAFRVDALLRGDSASRSAYFASAIQNGYMTPNEVRQIENLMPIAGGDKLFIQVNMQPLDMAGQAPAPQKGAPDNADNQKP